MPRSPVGQRLLNQYTQFQADAQNQDQMSAPTIEEMAAQAMQPDEMFTPMPPGGLAPAPVGPPPNKKPLSQKPVSKPQLIDDSLIQYAQKIKQFGAQRENEVEKLKQYMQDYAKSNNNVTDYRPLAAFVGGIPYGNKELLKAAEGIAPESNATKYKNLAVLQEQAAKLSGDEASTNAMIKIAQAQSRNQSYNDRTGVAQDRLANTVANLFDNDKSILQNQMQQQQTELDLHTLQTAKTITPQLMAEIQNGLARAVAGGGVTSEGGREAVAFNSVKQDAIRLQQRLTNRPEDVGSPEVKQMLIDTFKRLHEAYGNNIATRATNIANGRQKAYSHNPLALDVMNEKMNFYKSPKPPREFVPEDQAADQFPDYETWKAQKGH